MAWLAEVEAELVAAGRRRAQARRRRMLALGAAVPVVLLALVLLAVPRKPAVASTIRVVPVQGGVELRLLDPGASARDVIHDLSAAGLAVEVRRVGTGPSQADDVLWLRTAGGRAGDALVVADGDVVQLGVGVLAPAGVPYEHPTDAFADGEALHCLGRVGEPAGQLAAAATGAGVEVRWRDPSGADTPVGPGDARPVASALGVQAGVAEVFVADGPVPLGPAPDGAC